MARLYKGEEQLTFQPILNLSVFWPYVFFGTAGNSPSVRQVVDSRQSPGQMVRLLVRRSNSHTEPNILRCGGHSRDNSERLIHRPLRARDNRRIEITRSLVHIISAYIIRSLYMTKGLEPYLERQQWIFHGILPPQAALRAQSSGTRRWSARIRRWGVATDRAIDGRYLKFC